MEYSGILKWFEQIARIPRVSGNEQGISDWLVATARGLHLAAEQDEAGNVLIRKGKGKAIALQGHLDMVGEKETSSRHDFEKDPILLRQEGDMLYAQGTTLGADNGIALAIALCLLEENDPGQPALEVLMTTGEEVGLLGAKALKPGWLTAESLINLDWEQEGVFLLSCAGGETVHLRFTPEFENEERDCLRLALDGLLGGHSGLEIDKGRHNAIRELCALLEQGGARLSDFAAPGKFNAISRRAEALVMADEERLRKAAGAALARIQETEPEASLTIERAAPCKPLTESSSKAFLRLVGSLPYQVHTLARELPGLVESSSNIGLVEEQGGDWVLTASIRSSEQSRMREIEQKMRDCALEAKAALSVTGAYPGWAFEADNPLKDAALRVWQDTFGATPTVTAVHGGLECGIIKSLYPDMHMISMGADLFDAHTPREHVSLASAARMLHYLRRLLRELKD